MMNFSCRSLFFIFLSMLFSCEQFTGEESRKPGKLIEQPETSAVDSSHTPVDTILRKVVITTSEKQLLDAGLVDIQSIDSSIQVDLKYSSCDNFLFLDMYGDLEKCYLQPDVAEKLRNAQVILRKKFPYYSLIVYDGVRPRSIQAKMWDTIAVPVSERTKYVSNPLNGSLHNFGAAVDLSIIDQNGIELDMGTPYDFFGELAYPREEERMIKELKLSYKQLHNRQVLRDAMVEAGFLPITTEWWHFNSCLRREAAEKYKIIE
jgi:D-alanyl-D-alanine dipeptidase